MAKYIVAVSGSYRAGGVTESLVDAVLDAAAPSSELSGPGSGVRVEHIRLADADIRFCTNCRACTQQPGPARGACPLDDDMDSILDKIEAADAFILASPVNFHTATALMKRFIERLICYGYWPWSQGGPKMRITQRNKRALVIGSSAAPEIMARWSTPLARHLKYAARVLGAGKADVLLVGLAAMSPEARLSERSLRKARKLGRRLAQ